MYYTYEEVTSEKKMSNKSIFISHARLLINIYIIKSAALNIQKLGLSVNSYKAAIYENKMLTRFIRYIYVQCLYFLQILSSLSA